MGWDILIVVFASSCIYNYMESMSDDDNHDDRVIRLDNYWPYQITVLADRIARRTTKTVKAYDLNLSQWRVLAAIAEVPGRTSVEVVQITPMDKGIVSRATKALLDRGLVQREASQSDGRISHLHLTSQGKTLYRKIKPQVESVVTGAKACMEGTDQTRLSELLNELMRVIPDLR